jgi:hypothetical protein
MKKEILIKSAVVVVFICLSNAAVVGGSSNATEI